MSALPDAPKLALEVAAVLESADIRYVLSGSVASSILGEPRSTLGVADLLARALNLGK